MKRCILLVLSLMWPLASFAHEVRPSYLEMRETASGEFSVLWKTPMQGDARLALEPAFAGDVVRIAPVTTRRPPGAAVQAWAVRAPALRGQTLAIDGLEGTMTDALARIEFADGTAWTHRFTPDRPSITVPLAESALAVAGVYFKLGVEHILTGIDHLLFVLFGNLDGSAAKTKDMLEFEYARSALKNGLKLERDLGANPYSSAWSAAATRTPASPRWRRTTSSARRRPRSRARTA